MMSQRRKETNENRIKEDSDANKKSSWLERKDTVEGKKKVEEADFLGLVPTSGSCRTSF